MGLFHDAVALAVRESVPGGHMTVRRMFLVAPALAAALATPIAAQPFQTLGAYCTDGPVPQAWGAVPGQVRFGQRVLAGFGDGSVRTVSLTGSGPGVFGTLPCAMYGGGFGQPDLVGEIDVIPDGTSNTILFGELTLGVRGHMPREARIRIYNDDYSSLLFSSSVSIADGTSNTIVLGERVTGPSHLQWSDPWVAGVGSLRVQVSAVPEPATVALTAIGLGALAAGARRRRR